MRFLQFEKVFKVRIVYKSGFTQDFEVTSFEIKNGRAEWIAIGKPAPVLLGLDDIAAVWEIGMRQRIKWK